MSQRSYYYVGPAEIRHTARSQPQGVVIRSEEDLERWLATDPTDRSPAGNPIATFTIGSDKILRLAPRRSEHVACAGGEPVLSAGEITFDREGSVVEVTNQSTGYCPEPESWPVVAAVLSDVGVAHPGGFTTEIVFRLCPACHEPNVVKDSWFECQLCGAELPESWNVEQRCRDE